MNDFEVAELSEQIEGLHEVVEALTEGCGCACNCKKSKGK